MRHGNLIKDSVLSVWEERKVRLYGEHANVHQFHSQNDSGDLRGVAGGDGELVCLCGKAGTSHLCDGSAHSSGCVVNGSNNSYTNPCTILKALPHVLPLYKMHQCCEMSN